MKSNDVPAARAVPRVTIVMTARERHSLTVSAIESIVAHTVKPYRFIYAGVQGPEWLRQTLNERASAWNLEFAEFDGTLWPNQIRNRIMSKIDTDYVVFLDNDISVASGWLEGLVACADETGAGIVCPLYLIGRDASATKIHMAGGQLTEMEDAMGTALIETHRHADEDLSAAADLLHREACDFAEYHCVLIATRLAKAASIFDDRIVCVHEHIDTALSARKNGYSVYFEPAAKVTYWASAPYMLSDLDFFRSRWAASTVNSSIEAFTSKWSIANDARSFGGIKRWASVHLGGIDPLRPPATRTAALRGLMEARDLRQTLSGLFELAESKRYQAQEFEMLKRAYQTALIYANGLYRPCGRPFINHLVGTASVLVHYDFKAPVVAAGMLHAVYTHGADLAAAPQSKLDEICNSLGGNDRPLDKRVRAYTFRSERWKTLLQSPAWQSELSILDAEILAIEAANEIDMHHSGEFKFSGRRDMVPSPVVDLMAYVCDVIGVPGLAETVKAESRNLSAIPSDAVSENRQSFRLVGHNRVPAGNSAVALLLARDFIQDSGLPMSTR